MKEKIEKIKQIADCNAPATEMQIKLCNTYLRQKNLPEIPADFAAILMEANGFIHEGATVFGATLAEDEDWFSDILANNSDSTAGDSLLLGTSEDHNLLLATGKFQVVDRTFGDIVMSSTDPIEAITYFLS